MGQGLRFSAESSLRLGKLLRALGFVLPEAVEASALQAFYRSRRRKLASIAVGLILALSAANFLYIGMVDLAPILHHHIDIGSAVRQTAGLVAGAVTLAFLHSLLG